MDNGLTGLAYSKFSLQLRNGFALYTTGLHLPPALYKCNTRLLLSFTALYRLYDSLPEIAILFRNQAIYLPSLRSLIYSLNQLSIINLHTISAFVEVVIWKTMVPMIIS